MVFQGVVESGVVRLPLEASLPDGTIVRVQAERRPCFGDLMDLAGTWQGDDADRILDEIYAGRARSTRHDDSRR